MMHTYLLLFCILNQKFLDFPWIIQIIEEVTTNKNILILSFISYAL